MLKPLLLLCVCAAAHAQKSGTSTNPHILNPSPTTIAWGYYWSEAQPVLKIQSGDHVKVHTLITSTPERLEAAGLPSSEVEQSLRDVQAIKERGPGGHLLTGPIYVEGAEAGDRSEEHTSELQSRRDLVCRLLLEKKKERPGHHPKPARGAYPLGAGAPVDQRPYRECYFFF